ncbi:DUF4368 domain-containing protein [Paradesulfitobacterium aromaticivorans]
MNSFLKIVRKYTEITELTAEMLNEFIEKIIIHAPDKSTGKRTQQVDIYLTLLVWSMIEPLWRKSYKGKWHDNKCHATV